jgi:transglutaminase-like putative cysteine protease
VLLAAVAVTGNGLFTTAVHAQDANADPSATIRFSLPAPADRAEDAQRAVDDTPDAPTDQDDLTPIIEGAAEDLAGLTAEAWEVPALAATLADTDAAFALVRDGIRFDAYRGSLRGGQGTLSARAGNAFDRASLLKALLDARGAKTRFAFGTLDAGTAAALVARSFESPTAPLPDAGFAFDPAIEEAIEQRARRDHALLADALGDRLIDLDADATPLAVADVTAHAWIQIEQPDGSWLDLDPTLPDARPGQVLTSAVATGDAIPESERHTIGVRVLAEHLVGARLEEVTVMDETLPASAAGDQRIFLTFTPTGEGGGLLNPGGLLGGGGGPATWSPTLLIDHNAWDGDPILFSGEVGGGGLLGPGEQADLVRLTVELSVASPGAEPLVVRQVLADRLTPEQRSAGTASVETLSPVADDEGTPALFRTVIHLMVSTGATSPRGFRQDQGYAAAMAAFGANTPDSDDITLAEALVPAAVGDLALVMASERRFIPAIDGATVRSYIASPRLFLATRASDPQDLEVRSVVTDLAVDALRTLPRDGGTSDAAARRLWYGALEGAVETEMTLANASALDAASRTMEGVSFDMAQPLTVVTAADGVRPEAAAVDLERLLGAGGLAVVPGDVAAARTWWELSPDATTRSVLAPRLGGGGVRGPGGPRRPILPVNPPDKPRDQRKQQDDGKQGNEYGTLVENVAGKVEKGAKAGGRIIRDGFDDVVKPLIKLK